ncbi:MAG: ParA family protein [Planctomycetia bacterium]
MRIVAVINQKGGVGKTTTAVNLGAALALRGRKVLLVDLDPQGNLTDHLGLAADDPSTDERPSSYGVLMGDVALASAVLATATKGLWVLPSTPDLAGVEIELADAPGRESRLKQALAAVPERSYDWVLVDCPPSLGLLSLNAMVAAREVFITLQTEYLSLKGLGLVTRTVDMVREQVNTDLRISGIVATLVDPVTNLAREVIEEVRVNYGQRVFETRVRKNVRLAEAPSHGQHIFEYQPDSPGAADYRALAEEVEAWDPVAGRVRTATAPAAREAAPTPSKPSAAGTAPSEEKGARPKPAGTKPGGHEAAPAKGAAPARGGTASAAGTAAKPPIAARPAAPAKPTGPTPTAPATPPKAGKPGELPRLPGGRFAPRTPAAPAKPAAPAAAPKAASPKSAPSVPPAPQAKAPAAGKPTVQPQPAMQPKPAKQPKAATQPKPAPQPAPAVRPAVPSPGLRHERPWMKPPGK